MRQFTPLPTRRAWVWTSQRLGLTIHKFVFEGTYLVHFWLDETAGLIRVIGFRHGARLPRHGEP